MMENSESEEYIEEVKEDNAFIKSQRKEVADG
jgi:hypothetical protein